MFGAKIYLCDMEDSTGLERAFKIDYHADELQPNEYVMSTGQCLEKYLNNARSTPPGVTYV